MWSLKPQSLTQQLCTRLTSTTSIHPLTRVTSICPLHSILSTHLLTIAPTGSRHGHSGTQSHRANRAASRSSGGTYRAPKGRPGENVHHIKEPNPQVERWADARLPVNLRRKAAARARAELPKHERIDFEIIGGEVRPLQGHDSQKIVRKRVKTKVHKAIQLRKALAAQAAAGMEEGMEWNEEEQLAAEEQADRFVEAEFTPEEMAELEAMELEQLQAEEEESKASSKRRKSTPKVPTFGVQTVLKFLSEFDIIVKTPSKPKRGEPKPDASDLDESAKNPLNQDIVVYDVISRFNFADYIIVAKAQSARQMRHLAESAYKMARSLNACSSNPRTLSLEGRGREDWMLLDAGHIWIYFFNKTPTVTLPKSQGIFGVSFHLPTPNVQVSHITNFGLNRQAGGPPGLGQARLQPSSNAYPNSVSFSATSNPFNPTPSATSSRPAPPSDDPLSELHETASQINSTMWYEPTPDNPNAKNKSQINQAAQQAQMAQPLDSYYPYGATAKSSASASASNSAPSMIDASFTATSSPIIDSTTSSADSDPSLALLQASNFIHPVLENLERTYGDLRVPIEQISKVKDYPHEDLKNNVEVIGTRKGRGKPRESIEVQEMPTIVQRV